MPIYEYECQKCGERFSRLRPMREAEQAAQCPRCDNQEARRVVSVVARTGCAPSG